MKNGNLEDFISDEELNEVKEKNRIWQTRFDEVCQITFKARELEKENPYKAIELYESIKNTNYGNFDTLGRLIILYRRTKQKDKEIQHIEFKIEDEQNFAYNSKLFLQNRFPEEAEKIQYYYDNKEIYITPELAKIDFFKKIDRLFERLNKLKK